MQIGVISDTHGNRGAIIRAVKVVGPVDRWLHAGDHSWDGDVLQEISGCLVTAVAGNCDGWPTALFDEFIQVEGKKIWLTHGHRYRAKERSHELLWWAKQHSVDVVVYGHSHVAVNEWEDNILIFNPGSPAFPRGARPSAGLLDIHQGQVTARIIHW